MRILLALLLLCFLPLYAEDTLRVAVFEADATPEIGGPVAYAKTRSITDPLSARGIVILGSGQPIVLCAVDWIGIANEGSDAWREGLAKAAGTTMDRVAVHTLHQHDGVRCDYTAEKLLAAQGLGGQRTDVNFCNRVIASTADAMKKAISEAQSVSDIGVGEAKVEKVASNRRVLGPDGMVAIRRMSSSKDPKAWAAPEGTIDPVLKIISFWNGDRPIVAVNYYATHPMSFYGKGDVTCDFVGLARNRREAELGFPVVHFNGASGNVAAGKYNNGSPEARVELTDRMADGMKRAWEATKKSPITSADVAWKVIPTALPLGKHMVRTDYEAILGDEKAKIGTRYGAAAKLALIERAEAGHAFDFARLRLGKVEILHAPGELFVEYQLAAQKMKPDSTVCMACYGDYGIGYVGTEIAYGQGGYETQPSATSTSPQVEAVLLSTFRKLLDVEP